MKHNLMLKAYIWLITTLRDYGPITLKEINRLWKEDKIDDGNELDRFKFYRYKREIEEAFSLFINYDPNEGYSISNPNIFRKGSIENWMLSTMVVNYAIGNCADIKGRIGVENIPSSERFLKDIIQAMRKTHELQITYQAYGAENATTYIVQPYFLKLYHQRWYVIGPSDIRPIITLALDRIQILNALAECKKKGYIWGKTAYGIAFCVCRDAYSQGDNIASFERMLINGGIKINPGTIYSAIYRNNWMKYHISKWESMGVSDRVIILRDEIMSQLDDTLNLKKTA